MLGAAAPDAWRSLDLEQHTVSATRNAAFVCQGEGARVLGGPLRAATWLANELRAVGAEWLPGQILATGTCLVPVPVEPGDAVRMDFGTMGWVEARFA